MTSTIIEARVFRSYRDYQQWALLATNQNDNYTTGFFEKIKQAAAILSDPQGQFLGLSERYFSFYSLALPPPQPSYATSDFIAAANALPSDYSYPDYLRFIQFFGTHYVSSAVYGGKIRMDTIINRGYGTNKPDKDIIDQLQKEFMLLIGTVTSPPTATTPDPAYTANHISLTQLVGGAVGTVIGQQDFTITQWPQWRKTIMINPIQIDFKLERLSGLFADVGKRNNFEKAILQYTREYSIKGKREFPVGRDCADIMYLAQARNETVQDGEYYIDPHDFGWSSMKAWCDMAHGGYTIIDPQREIAWLNELNTYRTNDDFVTPLSGPQGQSPSYFSWKSWLALDKPSTSYRLSPDCKICNNNNYGEPSAMHHSWDSMAYYMTGDGFGCTYYNNKCPEAGDICRTCDDKFNLNETNSTCTHWIMPSYYSYRDTCTSYWNMAPSLGTRGKFCLCYKTDTFVNGDPIPSES